METQTVVTENGHIKRMTFRFTEVNRQKVGRVVKVTEPLTVLVSRIKEKAERLNDYYISFRLSSTLIEELGWRAGDKVLIGFDKEHGVGRIRLSEDDRGYKLFGKDNALRVRLTLGVDVPYFIEVITGSSAVKIIDKTMKNIVFKLPRDMYFSSH